VVRLPCYSKSPAAAFSFRFRVRTIGRVRLWDIQLTKFVMRRFNVLEELPRLALEHRGHLPDRAHLRQSLTVLEQ